MRLVIDIPDEEYEDVKKANGCYYDFGKAIVYGIPLPKGHGRLIDADKLISSFPNYNGVSDVAKTIDNAPTIIEADKSESGSEVGS